MEIVCIQCGKKISVDKNDGWWNDSGYGYSTKLTKCPDCGQLNIVKYQIDDGFDVNKDERWYE